MISKFRPSCPILVVSRDAMTCRVSHLFRGVYPWHYKEERDAGSWDADVNARIQVREYVTVYNGM